MRPSTTSEILAQMVTFAYGKLTEADVPSNRQCDEVFNYNMGIMEGVAHQISCALYQWHGVENCGTSEIVEILKLDEISRLNYEEIVKFLDNVILENCRIK